MGLVRAAVRALPAERLRARLPCRGRIAGCGRRSVARGPAGGPLDAALLGWRVYATAMGAAGTRASGCRASRVGGWLAHAPTRAGQPEPLRERGSACPA